MYIIVRQGKKHIIQKVEVLEVRKFDTKVRLDDGTILIRKEGQVIEKYEDACIIKEEVQISYDFKRKAYDSNDRRFVCNHCKVSGVDVRQFSLDHIKPLASYKGDLRANTEAWKWYWSEDNLQILCKRCNYAKGKLPSSVNYKIDKFARKKNMKKQKRAYNSKARNKVGFDVPTGRRNKKRVDIDTAMQVAKRDSRVLDLEMILGKSNTNLEK